MIIRTESGFIIADDEVLPSFSKKTYTRKVRDAPRVGKAPVLVSNQLSPASAMPAAMG
jgi:hypothetical protein